MNSLGSQASLIGGRDVLTTLPPAREKPNIPAGGRFKGSGVTVLNPFVGACTVPSGWSGKGGDDPGLQVASERDL